MKNDTTQLSNLTYPVGCGIQLGNPLLLIKLFTHF